MTVCWNERRGLEEGGGGACDAATRHHMVHIYPAASAALFFVHMCVCVCVRALAIMHAFVVNGSCKKHIRMYACV